MRLHALLLAGFLSLQAVTTASLSGHQVEQVRQKLRELAVAAGCGGGDGTEVNVAMRHDPATELLEFTADCGTAPKRAR